MRSPRSILLILSSIGLAILLLAPSSTPGAAQRTSASAGPTVYEAEDLARSGMAVASAGSASSQQMARFGTGWSGGAQLLWGGGQPGAVLELTFEVPAPALYRVYLGLTRAPDYGLLAIHVDGRSATATFDGYAPSVTPLGGFYLGGFEFSAGTHRITFGIAGKNPKSTGYLAGIDRISLNQAPQGSASNMGSAVMSSGGTPDAARLGLRTTLELWNGIGTVDKAAIAYVKEAVVDPNTKNWAWPFRWSTTFAGAKNAVLVASRIEPKETDPPLSPPGYVGAKPIPEGVPLPGEMRKFVLDIASWVPSPPTGRSPQPASPHLYMRAVLLDGNGQPVGVPSAPVRLTVGRASSVERITEIFKANEAVKAGSEAMIQKAAIHEVKILSHKPVVFPDPNNWGCVVVLENPHFGKMLEYPSIAAYAPGKTYCPPTDPATQQKSAGEWVVTALEGWVKAYDGLAHFYDEAKNFVAIQFANAVPCHLLGKKAEDDCKDAAKQLAGTAISVGLASAGVPPTLPDMAALKEMGKGKVVNAAVEFTCNTVESNGGTCTPEMRAQLAKAYGSALDEFLEAIERDGKEPGCGDVKTAKEHGKLPLPCFTDYEGVDVKPAPGSVFDPSRVTVRVTRVKPDPDFPMPGCSVFANVYLKNQFNGGWFSGQKAQPGLLQGEAFVEARENIPPLAVGKSVELTLLFSKINKQPLPGILHPDYNGWVYLYVGGAGTLSAHPRTDEGVALPTSPNVPQPISCGQGDKWSVQIPKQ